MSLGAPSRHQEFKVGWVPIDDLFSRLGNSPHDPHIIELLLHARLSKDSLNLVVKLLVVVGPIRD